MCDCYLLLRRLVLAVVCATVLAPGWGWAQSATNDSLIPFDAPAPLDWPMGLFRYSFGVGGPSIGAGFSAFRMPFIPRYTNGIASSLINTRGMRANRSYDIPAAPIPWRFLLLNYIEAQVNGNNSAYIWGEAFHDKYARDYLGVSDRLLDFKHNDRVNDDDFRALLDYMRAEMPNSNALPFLEWYQLYKKIGGDIKPDDGLPGVVESADDEWPGPAVAAAQAQPASELPGLVEASMTSSLPEAIASAELRTEPVAAVVPEPTTLALLMLGWGMAIRRR